MDGDEDADDEGLGGAGASGPMTGIVKSADVASILAKQKELLANENKMHTFFENPEKSIRVFMTSYSRAMGYIWYLNYLSPDSFC